MKISNHVIDRPRITIIAVLLVVAMAVLAGLNIPIQRTPAITKALVLVAVPFPGALPVETEVQITQEIEKALQSLANVDFIASTSMRGSSVTQIAFLDGVDPDLARGEVKDRIDQIRRELPIFREVQPIVTKLDFENAPLMLVNLTPPPGFDERALKQIAEEVQEDLEVVPGVANTQLFGGREREIHVNVDLDVASQYGLTLADIRQAVTAANAELPGGQFNTRGFDYQVRNETKIRGADDVRKIVLAQDEGRLIRVADVAHVKDTYRRLMNVATLNGKDCATIIVYKEADINTYGTARKLKQKVEDLGQQYPFIEFSATRDTSEEISVMFRVLGSSFVFGAALVLMILSWSMGLRISALVLTAIPLSSAVGLIFLYAFGLPISNMAIFSFILVLGMVVDGAIIVAENIHRHIELGEEPMAAAKNGIAEVGTPVIVADLTTIAAYLPMLLVPGIMGDFMSVMPKVVSVALFGSILVDHFFIPVVAARWYSREEKRRSPAGLPAVAGHPVTESPPKALGWFSRAYSSTLHWSLDNPWAVVACSVMAFVWAIVMLGNIGFTFFPESDRGQFEIKYELPLGYSIHESIAAADIFTEPLQEMLQQQNEFGTSDLVSFVTAIGSSGGLATRIDDDPTVGPEFGTVMVELLPPMDRIRHEDSIIGELRAKIAQRAERFPAIQYSIEEIEDGPPGGADVAIRFTGDDLELLGRLAKAVAAEMVDIPGSLDVRTDFRDENPEIVVDPDPRMLGLFDITETDVALAVQMALNGDTSIELNLGDEDVTLRIQSKEDDQQSADSLRRLMLQSRTGRKATIGQVAKLQRTVGLYSVNRYDRKRAVLAKCNVLKEKYKSDDIFQVVRERVLPELGFEPVQGNSLAFLGAPGSVSEGVRATFTGQNEERDKNFRFMMWSMFIAVVLIFGLLILQFNSFRQAIIVLLTVPLSFVGVVAGSWLCSFPFSLASFIGLVSLTGIVVNDAIVVVDFINQFRARGLPLREAIAQAAASRLRPVLLTTATTVGGLLPLMLNLTGGAEFWQPLTGAIIFGLSCATVLTLIVIPVTYSLAYREKLDRPAGR